ncbi:hypothetical protein J3R30DRAFT_3479300 [Lentinula aciculospora]|uniref:Uncharacterized protein n=1 Tax=Lentinula aciculospora TaxID=153920 RepID=A0A9W9ABD2_9AGAR|nr:hypothetical protein J3R30DRAFT_3479300 [Lentinula aciculospora]
MLPSTTSHTNSPLASDNEEKAKTLQLQKKGECTRHEAECKAEEEEEAASEACLAEIHWQKEEKRKEAEEWRIKAEGAQKQVEEDAARAEEAAKKEKQEKEESEVSVGKKRKRALVKVASRGDSTLGDNNKSLDLDPKDEDNDGAPVPTPSPQKPLKCDQCLSKVISCKLVSLRFASCQACCNAKVLCTLVKVEHP